ncbi:MAG TPA: SCO family protein [Chitinophagaceae bacterium]|nr:SCO family protein [Chitinophagaceae bacterium]
MQRPSTLWWFVAIVLIVPFSIWGGVRFYQSRFQTLPILGESGHVIDDFHLQNQMGHTISRRDWDDKIVVAHYFFTHCPSICPKMMYQLKRVQAYAAIPNVTIASFTVDPEHDSVGRLKAYAAKYELENDWNLLTGDKKILYRLARKSFMVTATDGDGGPDDFIHSEKLVLIDTQKRIRGFYNGTDEADVSQLIKDLQKLAEETR